MSSTFGIIRGLLATTLVVAVSLFGSLSVSPELLGGWGTVVLVAMVPAQIIISLVWQPAYPTLLTEVRQPLRGLALTAMNALVGLAVAFISWQTVGGGMALPSPMLIMFLIFAVPVTLALVVPLQCWPFASLCRNQGALGCALLLAAYGVSYLCFRLMFNFDFIVGAPFYKATLDPHGVWMAWIPLVFSIAMVVPMLGLILLDFWPISAFCGRFPALGRQPIFGLLAILLILAIAAILQALFVDIKGMDRVVFMVRICVTVNFGYFILLVMLEGLPALRMPQPWRGLVLAAMATAIASGMLPLYEGAVLAKYPLTSGGPAYSLDLWLASAMLAVTFPLLVVVGNYFQFWPFSLLKFRNDHAQEASFKQPETP